jgi:hypothetical protein
VDEFLKTQAADGSWTNGTGPGAVIDTALAVLFLIRSTQRAIGKLNEGVVFGGYELPKDISSIRMVGERVVSDSQSTVESLLEMMEDDKEQVSESMLPKEMQLSRKPEQRAAQVARLSRLLNSENYNARRLAVRLLGRSEDLSVVPDLIFALTDRDPFVPKLAEEGLRLLSRQLKTVYIKANPADEDRARAIRHWKEWYLGIRPDYIFIDR